MEFGQSRSSARGPLIAVIKIEIDSQRTDRIFLHQRDNDFRLAQQFVEKHKLNPGLIQHIYERVKYSRESVERLQQEAVSPRPLQYGQYTPSSNNNYKLQTPINHIAQEHDQYTEDQSFGNTNLFSDRFVRPEEAPFKNERPKETLLCGRNPKHQPPAPSKQQAIRAKQFLIYDKQNEEEEEGTEVNLFGSRPKNIVQPASAKKEIQEYMLNKNLKSSQKKSRNAFDIICQQQRQNISLRASKSMMKLNQHKESFEVQDIFTKIPKPSTTNSNYDNQKPSRVKIIKKQQMESLNQSMKKSMSKQEISRINKDVTKRLYNQANIKKNYLHIIKEKAKKDKEMQEDQELTLKPQINKVSRVIAEGRKKTDVPVQDYLIEEGKKAEIKRAEWNSKRLVDQLQQCSFKPTLNLISQKLAADKEYLESRISNRKSRYKDENTFRPSLNKITHELMKGKGSFSERQKQFLQLKNEKLMTKVHERLLGERIDLETGQELFKPLINDMGVREPQGANIGRYLHHLSKEIPESDEGKNGYPRISESSQNMVQQMYMRRITWLFSELDSDQDGIISAHKICIDRIDPEILSIIKPILFEMQEINEELTLLEFKNAIDILHKKLNISQKSILYGNKQKCK